MTADTGPFGSFAVWLNGRYLGSATTHTATHSFANMDDSTVSQTFSFPAGAIRPGRDNVVSALVENMGQDESFANSLQLDSDKTPRGLENATLNVSSGTAPAVTWRLDGASAAQVARDPVRGPTNPAGLFELEWYRTHFALHVPSGVWAPLGLKLTPPGGGTPGPGASNFQALICLKGWLIGRYINNLGPQNTFYLPQGLLRTDGNNTLAIAEWSPAPRRRRTGPGVAGAIRDRTRRDPCARRAQPRLSARASAVVIWRGRAIRPMSGQRSTLCAPAGRRRRLREN